ncbi:MAG: hypothetical protein MUE81_16385 [Thermoflexibacter sp.]|jgi:hypothetical protein|nr:hypothetical protein [Thermoflexibacter sp.]
MQIDIYSLKDKVRLSHVLCEHFSEAAAVCLDYFNHEQGVSLVIQGDINEHFELFWEKTTEEIRDSRTDLKATVEQGACCLAMLAVTQFSGYEIVKQSVQGTGFDFWLKEKQGTSQGIFHAILEISGILEGSQAQINQRIKLKEKQAEQSKDLNLVTFVIVVEFSKPSLIILKK